MHRLRLILGWALQIVGAGLVLFGVWAVGAYVWGVIEVLNEPDRSWIFWGLAILFIGIGAIGTGVGMVVSGRRLLSGPRPRR